MRRVYLDLDGVFFDFEGHFYASYGKSCRDVTDDEMWSLINKNHNFFDETPLFPGARKFFNDIIDMWYSREGLEYPMFLTACPDTYYDAHALAKKRAVKRELCDEALVLPMRSGHRKYLFMHSPGDILIDDFGKNIKPWNDHGGIGIKHENYEQTLKELHNALYP